MAKFGSILIKIDIKNKIMTRYLIVSNQKINGNGEMEKTLNNDLALLFNASYQNMQKRNTKMNYKVGSFAND